MTTRRAPATTQRLSLESLEQRILLAAINPGELAELSDGDVYYFIAGEEGRGERACCPN